MSKRMKEKDIDFNKKRGQAKKKKNKKMPKAKRFKESEKKVNKKDSFDLENEVLIQMANKNNIKKEQKRIQELEEKTEKRLKRNKKIKLFVKVIILFGIIVGGSIFTMTSPIFNISDIQVVNNNIVPSETIVSLSELTVDQNIFRFSSNKVKDKIKENAYVEDIKIHRKIPNVVQIEVIEREPKFSIDFMGKYAYINTQGYILEIGDTNMELPIIHGISTNEEDIQPNNRLSSDDLNALEDILKIVSIAKENNLDSKVTDIDISIKNDYSIYIGEEKKTIHLGDNTNLENKMLYAIAIMEKEKGIEGDIYVNGDLNNKFQPYFKEKV